MADLVLHHYKTSPFAQKIRSVLGFKQLPWQSVNIPPIAPKPDVEALTGGYRKTPILQIGADIYCDTALICDVLEHRQPAPSLSPPTHKGLARVLAQWADTTLFNTVTAYNFQPRGREQMFANVPPGFAQAFADDRLQMMGSAPRLRAGDATTAYKSYLRRLATMLEDQPYLVGTAPCMADFAVYAPLWSTRVNVPALAPGAIAPEPQSIVPFTAPFPERVWPELRVSVPAVRPETSKVAPAPTKMFVEPSVALPVRASVPCPTVVLPE